MASPKLIDKNETEYDLTTVENIITNKNAGLIILPIPLADSSATLSFDLIGMVKTIKVIGTFQGTEVELKAKRDSIEALCVGNQISPISFTSTKSGTLKVKIMDVTWSEVPGTPNIMGYEINLVESKDEDQ